LIVRAHPVVVIDDRVSRRDHAVAGRFRRSESRHARIATPTSPWLDIPLAKSMALEVHDATKARPRFTDWADGVTMLFYAEPAKLESVALPADHRSARRAVHRQTPGIALRTGVALDAEADDSGHRKVRS
jgi:hypothetical protein